jgi:hypothetical protein
MLDSYDHNHVDVSISLIKRKSLLLEEMGQYFRRDDVLDYNIIELKAMLGN